MLNPTPHTHKCLRCGFSINGFCDNRRCEILLEVDFCYLCLEDHPWLENARNFQKMLSGSFALPHNFASCPKCAEAIVARMAYNNARKGKESSHETRYTTLKIQVS